MHIKRTAIDKFNRKKNENYFRLGIVKFTFYIAGGATVLFPFYRYFHLLRAYIVRLVAIHRLPSPTTIFRWRRIQRYRTTATTTAMQTALTFTIEIRQQNSILRSNEFIFDFFFFQIEFQVL